MQWVSSLQQHVRMTSTYVVCCCRAGEPKAAALKCTKDEAHGGGTMQGWHKQLLESMSRSRFCMIVPGDTQSSERLTDAFVTGAYRVASSQEP